MRNVFSGEPLWRPGTHWPWYLALPAALAIFVASHAIAVGISTTLWPCGETGPANGSLRLSEFAMRLLVISQAAIVALTLLAATWPAWRPAAALRLQPTARGWPTYAAAIVAMIAVLIVINVLAWTLRPDDTLRDFKMFADTVRSPNPLVPALAIGLGAPLSEELLFRGFLLTSLASTRLGFWPATILVTLAWTLAHWGYSMVGLAEVFAIGLFLSWLLWRTGSLYVPLFCHVVYNSTLFLVLRYVVE